MHTQYTSVPDQQASLNIRRYSADLRPMWDQFVRSSRNGTFLFLRDYMEYHADRFTDHSLVWFRNGAPLALLPASEHGSTLVSHGGLTYGGVIMNDLMRTSVALRVFESLIAYAQGAGFSKILYKAVPHIYHRQPAEEDLYALFRYGGRLVRRDVSSTIQKGRRGKLSKGRKWSIKRARQHGLEVRRSTDFDQFMQIEADHLEAKFSTRPTHSGAELSRLSHRFPHNIQLYAAFEGARMLGGVVVYLTETVAHAQYIAASAQGWELGVTDLTLATLIEEVFADRECFDFGISSEQGGHWLNEGLIQNKESFGARATTYDHYELALS